MIAFVGPVRQVPTLPTLAVQGNLRTTTMRGFGEQEMESLLSSLT